MRRAPQLGRSHTSYTKKQRAFHGHSRRSAGAGKPWARACPSESWGCHIPERPFDRLRTGVELRFDKIRQPRPSLKLDLGQEDFEVFLDQLVEDGFFGTPPLVVDAFSRRRKLGCLVHRP
ncbi:MAG: hypothetical protein ACREYE_06790 [Gammaproteobacteria bacterium]